MRDLTDNILQELEKFLKVAKGDVRSGGSYWSRYSKINVWNSIMQEDDCLVKRWTEFLAA
jgi:putative spermidine/putrescine transport system substrate-binding protein